MSKSAKASRQTLFFVFDRYGDNETWAEGRGEASRRQKERGNPSTHRVVVKHRESWLSKRIAPLALLENRLVPWRFLSPTFCLRDYLASSLTIAKGTSFCRNPSCQTWL